MKKRLIIIIVAFCVSFITMVALSLFSMERFTLLTNYSDKVKHSHLVISKLYKAEGYLKDMDRIERGYILTHDTVYPRYFKIVNDSVKTALSDLYAAVKDNQLQVNNFMRLKSTMALRMNYMRKDMFYADTSNSTVLSSYYHQGREQMIIAGRKLTEMHKVEDELLTERFRTEAFYQKLTTNTLKYLLIVFCVITLFLFVIMIKELRSRVRYQEELQAKVIDLKRSHSELQEIAYAASHDLQEPLRKIQVFSNMLLFQKANKLDGEGRETLARINKSAERMQSLIADLVSLTNLSRIDERKNLCDLNRMLEFILIDIDDQIAVKKATITLKSLPKINGYDNQLKILFRALLDNSLKFTKDGVQPEIVIDCNVINGSELTILNPNIEHKKFYRINCADNGIGFDDRFISKIFRIFQRLHDQQSEYEGKGIGLAICQRVLANHEGYILAHGEPMNGAVFSLYFPVDD